MSIQRLLHILVFSMLCSPLAAQIDHVEPLNWWVGMKNPALQIMVHGKGIGETMPSINYPGVTIKKVHKAESKNYLFIDVLIAGTAKPGSMTIDFKQAGKTIASTKYSLLKRDANAAQQKGFDASDVIYLITPDRFANGDPANDVVAGMKEKAIDRKAESGRHGGDIQGIIDHLDYIQEMGFTAIWPSPLLENNMVRASYHGYSITDHYKVDPRFGTMDLYKELSAKAAAKGMKLIFDGVVNHIGLGYWWMNDLPFKDWLNFTDSLVMTNHQRTVNQDPYASKQDKALMTKGWFDDSMPDMNGENPFMSAYLIQNSIWWIETLHLGGIRQDTYCYSDKSFLKNWSCSIMNEYPRFNIVGEEWSTNPLIAAYWQQGKKNIDGYSGCLKTTMDFPLQAAMVQAMNESDDFPWGVHGLTHLYVALANDFAYADPSNLLVFADNHDMDRIYTQLKKDAALTKMAITYLLTMRGIPQVYYGTEILMDNTEKLGNHGLIRTDFPGGWAGDSVNAFTGKGLRPDQLDMQQYMKRLLNWRKQNPVIAEGKTLHFAPAKGLYVYFRYNAQKTVMVMMNKNKTAVKPDLKRFSEILGSKRKAMDVLSGNSQLLDGNFTVEPGATVFELN